MDTLMLLGKKVGQSTFFEDSGRAMHVTILQVGPCVVIQKKTNEIDGYSALQLGLDERKEKRTSKPLQGHFKKAGATPKQFLGEMLITNPDQYQVGQLLTVENFKDVIFVDVAGISKGKGFQGVVRRHGFRGGRNSHGSMFHRAPGGIGASSDPSRVFPGTRMPGRMGNQKTTILNCRVLKVDIDNHLLFVKGPVPGANQGLVWIRPSIKKTPKEQGVKNA
jgi:large subunit ribosomal protein L3